MMIVYGLGLEPLSRLLRLDSWFHPLRQSPFFFFSPISLFQGGFFFAPAGPVRRGKGRGRHCRC